MTRGRAALAAVAVTLPLVLVGRMALRHFSTGASVPVATVVRAPFARRITAEGNLVAAKATPLTAPGNDLTLKIAWLLDDGSPVKKGDVVVRFDSTQMEKNLEAGRAERGSADARTVKSAAESDAAIRNLDRDGRQARLELETARTFQRKDPEIFSRHAIIEADVDVDVAGSRERNASAAKEKREKLSKADQEILKIDRRKADAKVARAEAELKALEIVAPHDGFVVFRRDWRGDLPSVGQMLWSGWKLAEIPDVSSLAAEVWVLEADAGGLAPGKSARVVVESDPGQAWPGKIERIDGVPKPRIKGVPVQYYGVTVALERSDPSRMKPGQRVRAALALDERADALAIPRSAVYGRDGKKVVWRRRGSRFEPVEVTLGPAALGTVVVEKGLEPGDVIALRDPSRPASEAAPATGPATPAAPAAPGTS